MNHTKQSRLPTVKALLRKRHGLQKQIADRADLSEGHLSLVVSGARKATPELRHILASELGIAESDLRFPRRRAA